MFFQNFMAWVWLGTIIALAMALGVTGYQLIRGIVSQSGRVKVLDLNSNRSARLVLVIRLLVDDGSALELVHRNGYGGFAEFEQIWTHKPFDVQHGIVNPLLTMLGGGWLWVSDIVKVPRLSQPTYRIEIAYGGNTHDLVPTPIARATADHVREVVGNELLTSPKDSGWRVGSQRAHCQLPSHRERRALAR